MAAKHLDCPGGVTLGNEGDEPPFVRDVHRVEPENLARAAHVLPHRNTSLVDGHADAGAARDLVERAGEAAAGEIAQAVHLDT